MLTLGTDSIAGLTVAGIFTLMLVVVPSLPRFTRLWLLSMAAAIGYYQTCWIAAEEFSCLIESGQPSEGRSCPMRRWHWTAIAGQLLQMVWDTKRH